MRPGAIVVLPPCFDNLPRVGEAQEPVAAEALIPQRADEALSVGVLHRLARADEVQLHSSGTGSCITGTGSRGSNWQPHSPMEPRIRGSYRSASGWAVLIQIVLVCMYWSMASVPLSRASEPERL